jgi:hypothetical protein
MRNQNDGSSSSGGGVAAPEPVTVLQQQQDFESQVQGATRSGHVSLYVCPDCGGVLWQQQQEHEDQTDLFSFQCHVGHTVSGLDLLQQKATHLEALLGSTLRTLTEKRTLVRQFITRLPADATAEQRECLQDMERLDQQNERAIRQMLADWPNPTMQGYIVQEVVEEAEVRA